MTILKKIVFVIISTVFVIILLPLSLFAGGSYPAEYFYSRNFLANMDDYRQDDIDSTTSNLGDDGFKVKKRDAGMYGRRNGEINENEYIHGESDHILVKGDKEVAIDNIVPQEGERISYFTVFALDLAVPGGGHFYINNYYLGLSFAVLKLFGLYSIYYFYNDWEYKRSLYYAAKRADESVDPNHNLEFKDPDGGYKSVKEYRRDYDRAAQNITFAVLANVVLYVSSLTFLYFNVKELNERSYPLFEFQYNRAKFEDITDDIYSFSFVYRI